MSGDYLGERGAWVHSSGLRCRLRRDRRALLRWLMVAGEGLVCNVRISSSSNLLLAVFVR